MSLTIYLFSFFSFPFSFIFSHQDHISSSSHIATHRSPSPLAVGYRRWSSKVAPFLPHHTFSPSPVLPITMGPRSGSVRPEWRSSSLFSLHEIYRHWRPTQARRRALKRGQGYEQLEHGHGWRVRQRRALRAIASFLLHLARIQQVWSSMAGKSSDPINSNGEKGGRRDSCGV